MKLKDKVVLITGSSSGIGSETAKVFAREGSVVIITYIKNKKEADSVANECRKRGAKDTAVVKLDITNDKSIQKTIANIIKKYGRIDVLVNNAGVICWKYLVDQTFKEIEQQIRINLEGSIKMTKEVLKHMLAGGIGIIINVGSGAGKSPHPTLSTYCATKFGIRGFTKVLAIETKGTGIKVYCVNPDKTATAMTGYEGRPPKDVAEVIVNTAKEDVYKQETGADIDLWVVKPLKNKD